MLPIFIIIFSAIITRQFATSENLALFKPAYQSSTYRILYANNSVNGRYDQNHYYCAHGNDTSGGPNWLVIDLLEVYYVNRITLTPRSDLVNDAVNSRMDYIYIGITNMFDDHNNPPVRYGYPLCRQSPYKANISINMSIECRPNTPPGRYVVVQQPVTGPGYLTVCEIQVFGVIQKSEGCGNSLYGEHCDKMCYCDKSMPCDRQNGTCPNKCDDNWTGNHCDTRLADYKDQLVGCLKYEVFSHELNRSLLSTTNKSCLDECCGYGYNFASVFNNSACLCTDEFNWLVSSLVSCTNYNELCSIYPSSECDYKGKLQLYSVCPNGTYGYNCSLKCNCVDNTRCHYMNGYCEMGCSPGWSGFTCDIRNCSQYNGGCDVNEICVTNSSDYKSSSCICNDLYSIQENHWSLCIVCPNGTYGNNCGLKCNCVNNTRCYYLNGTCEMGYSTGWTGISCNIRNCSENNGGCNKNEICLSKSNKNESNYCECEGPNFVWENDQSPCAEIKWPLKAIIGGVVGSVCGLLLVVAMAILIAKNKNRLKRAITRCFHTNTKKENNITLIESPRSLKLEEIPNHVESNTHNFKTEFQNLYTGNLKVEYDKNLDRFKNIIPFDFNRVVLTSNSTETNSNYINASHIKGILQSTLIATQAPKPQSENDFWRMIWQEDIGIIVMLCNLFERKKKKCEQYWPISDTMTSDKFTVTHQHTNLWPYFTMTQLNLTNANNEQRHVTHLHFNKWPDHGVPDNAAYFLSFCSHFRRLHESKKCGVVVHCSAGVGRTGCFLAVCDLLNKGYQGLDINVPECVNNLRKQRIRMVEKQELCNKFLTAPCGKETNVNVITSSYRFYLISSKESIWNDISSDIEYAIIFDVEEEEIFLPKDNQPIDLNQNYISLLKESATESGKRLEIKIARTQQQQCYENIGFTGHVYENTDTKDENIVKVYIVIGDKEHMDFTSFMEIFKEIVNQKKVAITLTSSNLQGNFFMAACNIISQFKIRGEVAIFQNLLELNHVTGYQASLKCYEKIFQLIHECIPTSFN